MYVRRLINLINLETDKFDKFGNKIVQQADMACVPDQVQSQPLCMAQPGVVPEHPPRSKPQALLGNEEKEEEEKGKKTMEEGEQEEKKKETKE